MHQEDKEIFHLLSWQWNRLEKKKKKWLRPILRDSAVENMSKEDSLFFFLSKYIKGEILIVIPT